MNQNSIETALHEIATGQRPSTDLFVQYDDRHGLWGGMCLWLSGDGHFERHQQERGAPEASVTRGPVPPDDTRALASLLLDLQAWRQATPDRAPFPDESRATLTIHIGDTAVSIWEWVNELAGNGRIIRIRDRMLATAVGTNSG